MAVQQRPGSELDSLGRPWWNGGGAVLTGFNSNTEYQGRVFHVQTEDGGEARPYVTTHVFLEGTVVASIRLDYPSDLKSSDLSVRVRELMERQHATMLDGLKRGEWDSSIPEKTHSS